MIVNKNIVNVSVVDETVKVTTVQDQQEIIKTQPVNLYVSGILELISEPLGGAVDGLNKEFNTSKPFKKDTTIVIKNQGTLIRDIDYVEQLPNVIMLDEAPVERGGMIDNLFILYREA